MVATASKNIINDARKMSEAAETYRPNVFNNRWVRGDRPDSWDVLRKRELAFTAPGKGQP